jgi:hypothetical protein
MAFGKAGHPYAWWTTAGRVERNKSTLCAKEGVSLYSRRNLLPIKTLWRRSRDWANTAESTPSEFATAKASIVVIWQHSLRHLAPRTARLGPVKKQVAQLTLVVRASRLHFPGQAGRLHHNKFTKLFFYGP